MSKDKENMLGFKIFKKVLGAIFKLYYNPTIIGEENVLEEGAMIVVGNHVHIMDQCLPILGIRRPIHYMAKREYFDNKMVAWFFKLAGCIPVDRSVKDNNAKEKALNVLREGLALGIFPEGTRNGLKQEKIDELYKICKKHYSNYRSFVKKVKKQKTSQVNYLEELVNKKIIKKKALVDNIFRVNDFLLELVGDNVITKEEYDDTVLLPFKFGAVSMAKKTNAYLVPFGITGKYKFRSKDLTVRIGKPIKVGDDLEEANDCLRKEVIRLMQESIENSGK